MSEEGEKPSSSRWFVAENGETHELFLIEFEATTETARLMVSTGYPSFATRAEAYRAKDWMMAWLAGTLLRLVGKSK